MHVLDLQSAWRDILKRAKLVQHHKISREELSVREHMSIVLRRLQGRRFVEFGELFDPSRGSQVLVVTFIAMLELAKETLIELTQAEAFAPIYVRLAYTPTDHAAAIVPTSTRHRPSLPPSLTSTSSSSAAAWPVSPPRCKLAPTHRVAVVTKRGISDGSSNWAQGGIAAVLAEGDSFASHVDDTLVAGAGLCDLDATRFAVENAPAAIAWLQELGVPFSTEHGAAAPDPRGRPQPPPHRARDRRHRRRRAEAR